MESLVDYIREYSHTRQIILKSWFNDHLLFLLTLKLFDCCRTLISSIRKGGRCPCPRCLVPKSELSQFGTQRDKTERKSLAHVDSRDKRRVMDMARQKIYRDKYSVNCKAVEEALKGESRVPTSVGSKSHNTIMEKVIGSYHIPECILNASGPL
jgi:hypothetical protein